MCGKSSTCHLFEALKLNTFVYLALGAPQSLGIIHYSQTQVLVPVNCTLDFQINLIK